MLMRACARRSCAKLRSGLYVWVNPPPSMLSFAQSFKLLPIAGAVAALSLVTKPAQAVQSVTINTTSVTAENNPSKPFSSTPSAVNFTVINPNPAFDVVGGVNTNSDGLCAWAKVGTTGGRCGFNTSAGFTGQTLTQLQGTFNKTVILNSFIIGAFSSGNIGTTLTFQSGAFSETFTIVNSAPTTYNFTIPNKIAAGDTLDIISTGNNTTGTNGGFFRIRSLDVTDVPGPLPLLGGAAAFGWSRKLRKKTKVAR